MDRTLTSLINIERSRIDIMYNPVDLDRAITKGKLRNRLGINDRKLIGWVGRLSPEKDPDLFIEVAEQLPDNIEFVMIGEGWKPDINIEYLEKIYKSKANIHWIRDVDPNDIMDYIADMDVICNTSNTEGHPFTLLEAMAVKVPVVTKCVGSVDDFVDDDTGYLVYRDKDYADVLRIAIEGGEYKVDSAYTNVLLNHNLKDYVRKMEIIYLESYYKYLAYNG